MPEGDTVYKLAQLIRAALMGSELLRLEVRGQSQTQRFEGMVVEQVRTYGKHLVLQLGPEWALRVHLGMQGSWRRYPRGSPPPLSPQLSILLETAETILVCFKAMEVELFPWTQLRWHRQLQTLGPDLLSPLEPDWDRIVKRIVELHEEQTILAELLLDQRVAAGLGNVYRSELPFLGPLEERPGSSPFLPHPERAFDPWTSIAELSIDQLKGLYQRGRHLLLANLGGWQRTTRFDRRVELSRQGPSGNLWVYGRRSEPCWRCGSYVRSATLGLQNRIVYWCPQCQASKRTRRPPPESGEERRDW